LTLIFLFASTLTSGDLGEIARVAEVEADAHRRAFRQRLLAPAGFLGHELEHAARPHRIETAATAAARSTAGRRRRLDERHVSAPQA